MQKSGVITDNPHLWPKCVGTGTTHTQHVSLKDTPHDSPNTQPVYNHSAGRGPKRSKVHMQQHTKNTYNCAKQRHLVRLAYGNQLQPRSTHVDGRREAKM